jgi:tetratricopeptide (TPR) repeat protein
MLVGREAERAEIEALLEDARRGRSRVLVLTGEAGIGKSALLEFARERAAGMRVLSISGVESESTLPFGTLHALLRPILGSIDDLPERQRTALAAALALSDDDEPDRLAACAGALTLLAEAATAQPLLVLIDDAHWVDAESADAVTFVARRVAGEELALVAAVRTGEASAFDYASLSSLEVPPLSEADSLDLLHARHGELLRPEAARAVVAVGAGNPLALVELPQSLSPDQLAGAAPLEEPLPLAARIESAFLRRTARLTAEARDALLVAAAGPDAPVSAIRGAAAAIGAGDPEHAEAEGLVRVEDGGVRFIHPLLRSAVYQAAAPADRRRAHQALAAELVGEPDLRAWQLAAAAEGPDEEIAAALEAAGDRAVTRGGHGARARALERAADLSPDPTDHARRLAEAALAAFWSGDTLHAVAVCGRTLPLVEDPLVRADLVHQYVQAAGWLDQVPTLPDLAQEAARVEELDADRAAKLLLTHVTHLASRLEYAQALAVADRMALLVDRLGPWWQPRARSIIADCKLATGDGAGYGIQDELVANHPIVAATTPWLVFAERYEDAERVFADALEYGRTEGNVIRVAYSQTMLGLLEFSLGRLARARVHASDGLELSRGASIGYFVADNLLRLAMIDALQGREESCREQVAEALVKAPDRGFDDLRVKARLALGLLESSFGRFEKAVDELGPVHEQVQPSGLVEPSAFPYQPELIEAYARLGHVDEAVAVLDWFEAQAEAANRKWAVAAAARCRGLLAGPAELDTAFGVALERHEDVPSPFERARTELVYGERLRRANRRRDARPHLRAALDLFDEIGAAPWSDRAQAELRATGEQVRRRAPDRRDELTPQELQIATLVAQGLTNRGWASRSSSARRRSSTT